MKNENGRGRVWRSNLLRLAGRPRPLGAVAVTCAILLVVLACIYQLLELPGPSRSLSAQLAGLFDAASFADRLRSQTKFWSDSPTMLVLSGAFLVIDAFLFVPVYAALLTGLRSRWVRSLPPGMRTALRWRRWRWLLGALVVADLIENLLTWFAVQGMVFADLLRYATILKWLIAMMLVATVIAVALVRYSLFRSEQWRVIIRRALEVLRDSARYLWLHVIPLFMLFGGLAMLAGVPQSREIIADLGDATTGSTSRLTTLTVTSLMLVVWIAACGLAFAWVRKVDPKAPREDTGAEAVDAAVLPRAHQLLVGLAALVATNAVLVRMSPTQGAALSVFIVAGCIGLWVVTSRLCTFGFKAVGLPQYRLARPVGWRAVAQVMLLYLVLVAAWRFMPRSRDEHLSAWGLFKGPGGIWHFNAEHIDQEALQLVGITALVALLYICALMLVSRRKATKGRSFAGIVFVTGLLIWVYTAWTRLGAELLTVQTGTIVLASVALWLLTHRATLAEYETWQQRFYASVAARIKLPDKPAKRITAALSSLFGTVRSNVVRSVIALVVLFFLLPHTGNSALVHETGTLAVVFAALSFWGLFATWLLVYLPMSKGLGNWTLAPLAWLAVVGLLPNAPARVDKMDNPSVLAAAADGPSGKGNIEAPTLHRHFVEWRSLLPDGERSPVFVVAAAGGGLRAAYWSAVLLAEMDDRTCGQFGRHVIAASGVSGGSLGVALYAAQRRVWQSKALPDRCTPGRAAQMRQILSGDFLAPIASTLLFADVPMAFVPFASLKSDRSEALTAAVQRRWAHAFEKDSAAAGMLEKPLRQALPALSREPAVTFEPARYAHPVVYFNATSVETGRRVIASNVTLGSIPADPLFYDRGTGLGTRMLTARTSLLDSAMHSARFPVISSAGKVMACSINGAAGDNGVCPANGEPYGLHEWGHLLDGGYFENSGLETVGDALQSLQQPLLKSVLGELPPVFLIAISNDAGTRTLCSRVPTPRFPAVGASLPRFQRHFLNSPHSEAKPTWRDGEAVDGSQAIWKALLSVREGRARLELERMVRRLGCPNVLEWSLGEHLQIGQLEDRGKEGEGSRRELKEPALGWLLSASSMKLMDKGIARYADAFPFDRAACPQAIATPPRGLIGAAGDRDSNCQR